VRLRNDRCGGKREHRKCGNGVGNQHVCESLSRKAELKKEACVKECKGRDECDGEKVVLSRNFHNLFILIPGLCQHVEATLRLAQLILRPWLGIVLDVANRLLCQISVRAARIAKVIQAVAPAFEPLNFACPHLVTLDYSSRM